MSGACPPEVVNLILRMSERNDGEPLDGFESEILRTAVDFPDRRAEMLRFLSGMFALRGHQDEALRLFTESQKGGEHDAGGTMLHAELLHSAGVKLSVGTLLDLICLDADAVALGSYADFLVREFPFVASDPRWEAAAAGYAARFHHSERWCSVGEFSRVYAATRLDVEAIAAAQRGGGSVDPSGLQSWFFRRWYRLPLAVALYGDLDSAEFEQDN